MKFLNLCAFIVVGVVATLNSDEKHCIDQLNLDNNVIEKLLKEDHFPLDNTDLMNFLTCFSKKVGIEKQDGNVNWDKIDDYIGKALENLLEGDSTEESSAAMFFIAMILKNVVDECHTEKYDGSHGETIANFRNCVFDGLGGKLSHNKQRPDWDSVKAHCLEKTKIDKSVVVKLNNGSILPINDKEINKYMKCEWERIGALKEDGTLDWYRIGDLMCRKFLKLANNPVDFIMQSDFIYALRYCEKQYFMAENPGELVVKVQNCINNYTQVNV